MALLSRSATLLVCLAAVTVATPAWSATVSKLRVGQHPEFTRVVFELDAAAGYRLERSITADGKPIVIVTLAATLGASAPRKVRSASSLLESVSLDQPQDRAVATIRLRRANLPIKEMILRGPPRVVLDVVGADTALTARARAKPRAQAAPAAERPKPAPVAQKPAVQPEPPKPTPVAQKPAVQPEPPKPVPTPAPAPHQVAQQPEPAAEKKPAPTPGPEPSAAPKSEAERAAQEAMDRRLAAVREAAEKRKRQLEEERQRREAEEQRKLREAEAEAERERREAAQATPAAADDGAGTNMILIGGVAGVLLVVVIVAVVLARRRTLPRDLDVSSIGGADFEGPADELAPLETQEQGEASESAEPLFGPDEHTGAPLSAPGLFEEPEKGESAMETHVQQLPMDRSEPIAAPPGPDLANLVADLERRLSALESQLQESDAARERLERQVAAQSEELRVQRAAIARTQRALRGLSRSEEEQATEPALRD